MFQLLDVCRKLSFCCRQPIQPRFLRCHSSVRPCSPLCDVQCSLGHKKVSKADFCKVFSSSIRSRLANEPESTESVVSLRETITEASILTPILTPVTPLLTPAPTPAANSDQDDDKTSEVHRVSSDEPGVSPQDREPNRKRPEQVDPSASEEANFDDCGSCQGHGKRRKHSLTHTRGNIGLDKANMIKSDPG